MTTMPSRSQHRWSLWPHITGSTDNGGNCPFRQIYASSVTKTLSKLYNCFDVYGQFEQHCFLPFLFPVPGKWLRRTYIIYETSKLLSSSIDSTRHELTLLGFTTVLSYMVKIDCDEWALTEKKITLNRSISVMAILLPTKI
jgi:hypothetical protein